ncbi:MAG: hypothetical protein HKN33_18065 [Pyrinomonadaceae bacterium]|nr:hypothetical protein [Pyrinomonadaceae bacterium]
MEKATLTSVSEGGARLTATSRWSATCPLCSNSFSSKASFRKHVSTHPRCGKCGRRFTTNTSLGTHTLSCRGQG